MTISGPSSRPVSSAPPPKQQDSQEVGPGEVLVKKGDTLSKLAKEHGVSVQDFVAANPQIKDPDKIKAGAVFNIPQAKAQEPAAAAAPTPKADAATSAGARQAANRNASTAMLQSQLTWPWCGVTTSG